MKALVSACLVFALWKGAMAQALSYPTAPLAPSLNSSSNFNQSAESSIGHFVANTLLGVIFRPVGTSQSESYFVEKSNYKDMRTRKWLLSELDVPLYYELGLTDTLERTESALNHESAQLTENLSAEMDGVMFLPLDSIKLCTHGGGIFCTHSSIFFELWSNVKK